MSLIEVVVGIALMGTLASSVIMAGSAHLRQLNAAQQKRRAAEALESFLTHWSRHDFVLEQASLAAAEAGVILHGQAISQAVVDSSKDAGGALVTLALEPGVEIPELRGRVLTIVARIQSAATVARAEIVISDE
jgi:type II secretory pathway pseudopilin PulG